MSSELITKLEKQLTPVHALVGTPYDEVMAIANKVSFYQHHRIVSDLESFRIHPYDIKKYVKDWRDAVAVKGRVLFVTNNPLIINEMDPEEVTLCYPLRTEGMDLKLLKDTYNFEERFAVYALGELWLSFTDGKYEDKLLGRTKTKKPERKKANEVDNASGTDPFAALKSILKECEECTIWERTPCITCKKRRSRAKRIDSLEIDNFAPQKTERRIDWEN
jgi:hypothetical protein